MSYVSSTDFIALLRKTPNGVRLLEMPGLDYVLAALSRAGMFRMWVSQVAPTTNQTSTVWLKPAQPTWSAEGFVLLWDASKGMFVPATPELWYALLSQGAQAYVFQSITSGSGAVDDLTTFLAVQRDNPAATTLTLPPIGVRNGRPLTIVDYSVNVANHLITLQPFEIGATIMRQANWKLYSTADQLGGVTLHPSVDLTAWVIAP